MVVGVAVAVAATRDLHRSPTATMQTPPFSLNVSQTESPSLVFRLRPSFDTASFSATSLRNSDSNFHCRTQRGAAPGEE